jgi:anaerobic carbon-monoxide dehydrogenase iron sulfur subunit
VKIITINPEKCSGCRLCESACSLKNSREFNPLKARIKVMGFDEMFTLPLMCFQCEKPYCMEACPANAITKDESTGVVKVSEDKCIGCKLCTIACPFGNITFSGQKKVVVKCELCDQKPECATFCPTGALKFGEADTSMFRKKAALAEKLKGIYEGMK